MPIKKSTKGQLLLFYKHNVWTITKKETNCLLTSNPSFKKQVMYFFVLW